MSRSASRCLRRLCCMSLLLSALCGSHAGARAQGPRRQTKPSQPGPAVSEQRPGCGSKRKAVLQVRTFVEQAKAFQDLEAKVRAASELGSLLWPCDPLYAEAVFLELHQTLKGEIKRRQERREAADGVSTARGDRDAIPLGKLKYLHSNLLARINLHNPSLLQRLAKHEAVAWADVNYSTVKALLGEGDVGRAAAELRKSVESGDADVGLLITLRQRDPAAADSLYLAHLNNLARRPTITSKELAEAGAYLFVSNPASEGNSVWLVMASVDGTLVPHFAARHPAASERALRSYLGFVASLLAQPSESPGEKKARYALARILLPYVPQSEPELLTAFLSGSQRLAAEVSEGIKNDRAYELLANSGKQTWDNLDRQLEGIEKLPLAGQRDELYVMLAHSLYTSRLYEKALKVVGRMSPSETRGRLETAIKLAVADQHLSRKEPSEAQKVGFGITPGYERAILWLGYAQAVRAAGDEQAATQSVIQAASDARRGEGPERPLLLLKAAGAVRASDSLLAEQWRAEAFGYINAFEKWRAPAWEVEAVARRATLKFPLAGSGGTGLATLLEPFVKDDPAAAESAIAELKSEQLRTDGLLVLAKHLLAGADREAPARPPANGSK